MQLTQLTILKQALIGKKIKHKNQYNRDVILEVEDITTENGSRELEAATPANDWWPETEYWTNHYLHFVDGSKIKFNPDTTIDIVD